MAKTWLPLIAVYKIPVWFLNRRARGHRQCSDQFQLRLPTYVNFRAIKRKFCLRSMTNMIKITTATLMREVKYYLQLLLRQVLSLLDYSQWVYVDKSSSKLRKQIESQSQQESPLASMSTNSSCLWQEMINEIFLNDRPGWCFEDSRFFWSFVKFALRSQFFRDVVIISVISHFAIRADYSSSQLNTLHKQRSVKGQLSSVEAGIL